MISAKHRMHSFDDLAAYLISGRSGKETNRVAWTEGLNLPTNDPTLAATIMRHTASQNPRVASPGLHLTLSFDPTDTVDDATVRQIAIRYLDELGLTDHQVMMVAHRDRAHRHVHLMVNRIDPITNRAWHLSHDYRVSQLWERAIENEFGFRSVPGRLSPNVERPFADHERLTIGECRSIERTGEQPLVQRARALVPDLLGADSWAEMQRILAAHGMRIQPRGQGLVVTDEVREVKASRVSPALTTRGLERRFQGGPRSRSAEIIDVDLLRLIATLTEIEQLRASRTDTGLVDADLAAYRHEDGRLALAARRVEIAWADFDRGLSTIYANPLEARERFSRYAHSNGVAQTTQAMMSSPELFGTFAVRREDRAAGVAHLRASARNGIAGLTARGLGAIEAEHEFWQVAAEVRSGRISHEFRRAMRRTFADGDVAQEAFFILATRRGASAAAEILREKPEQMGALRVDASGGTTRARLSARAAAELGEAAAVARFGPGAPVVTENPTPISIQEADRRALKANESFRRALAKLFQDANEARAAFEHLASENGLTAAARQLRERPEAFGVLKTESPTAVAFGVVATRAIQASRAQREAELLRKANARSRESADLDNLLITLYVDPRAAKEAIIRASAARGSAGAAQLLRTHPEQFGPLRGDSKSDMAAITARAGEACLRYMTELSDARDELSALKHTMKRVAAETARQRDATGGRMATLSHEVATMLDRLSPEQLVQLRHWLSIPQRALVLQIRSRVRDTLLGRDVGDR